MKCPDCQKQGEFLSSHLLHDFYRCGNDDCLVRNFAYEDGRIKKVDREEK